MAGKQLQYIVPSPRRCLCDSRDLQETTSLQTRARATRASDHNLLTTMADEPRRSGRATKGQHKNLELPDAPKKGKGKAKSDKSSKASAEPTPGPSEDGDEDEEEIIRCICGEYEEEEDVERDMICCDSCSAWQHNDCMGLNFPKGQEPDNYYCEQCRPANHKALLDKIAKGERPWEIVAERRRREQEEKKSKRKKGSKKGGKKSRPSDVKTEGGTPARAGTSATPGPATSPAPAASASAEPEKNGHSAESRRSSTNKRKLDESAETEPVSSNPLFISPAIRLTDQSFQAPNAKQPRVSSGSPTTHTKIEPDASGRIEDLDNPARKSAATALVKLFGDQIADAQKAGSFVLKDQSPQDAATRLGVDIESAIYRNLSGGSGEPDQPYKIQLRTIIFNVKKNSSLRDQLLTGSLTPDSLSIMKSEEMASKELQQKDAEIKREADRQHTIIQEQGPRIRRTHKGEELIEDETHNATTESIFSAAPRRLTTDLEGSPGNQSPITPRLQQGGNRKSDEKSPRGDHHDQVFPEVATNIREPVHHGQVQADADIDKLLRDDEPDSPPYSPKDYQNENILWGTTKNVWRGKLAMPPIGGFSSSGRFVGGADFCTNGPLTWEKLAPTTMNIDGRIDIKLATDYVAGLQHSWSTDVSILAVTYPDAPSEQVEFNRLFDYLVSRNRYGVIGKHPEKAVKDTYLVPVEAGAAKGPEFLELMSNNHLEHPTTQRTFLLVFVIKITDIEALASDWPGSARAKSHISQEATQATTPLDAQGRPQDAYQMQSIPQGAASMAAAPSLVPPKPSQAAIETLGPFVNSATVRALLKDTPDVPREQLQVVRNILDAQPSIADNYDSLVPALVKYYEENPPR